MARGKRSIHIEGVRHTNPIPMGARLDNVVWSSAIQGMDPATGLIPDDGIEQVRFAFDNLASFLATAGVTKDDVIRLTVYVGDPSVRDEINRYWLEWFPNEEDRPARHSLNLSLNLNMLVQLEVVAVAGQ